MYPSSAYFTSTFAAQNYPTTGCTTGHSDDLNLQFFRQTFQEPLQYGMASYERPATMSVKSLSSASTERWPSDEQFEPLPNGPFISTDTSTIAGMLPIRDLQHLMDLENRIASVQQYECLLSHLQILMIRYQGSLSDMLRNFITDPVLGRIRFTRNKNETCDCAMKTDLQRIMMAIKASWFPDKDQSCFEVQISHLLKQSHARCQAEEINYDPQYRSPVSAVKGLDQPTGKFISAGYRQTEAQVQKSSVSTPKMHNFQQNAWYQYALYYRDRYQIVRKANQKLKSDYAQQERDYRKRISECLKRVRAMQMYLNVLEERVQQLE